MAAASTRSALKPLPERLFQQVLESGYEHVPEVGEGFDVKGGPSRPPRERVKDAVLRPLAAAGFGRRQFDVEDAAAAFAEVAGQLEGLTRTDERLADDWSRELLVRLLAYRILGPRHIELPITAPGFWEEVDRVESTLRRGDADPGAPEGFGTYEIPTPNGLVTLVGLSTQIVEFFVLGQYAYDRGGVDIAAEPGDVVIDGGGGLGDTALYFADRVGPEGKVVVCEFVPHNLDRVRANLAANPDLAPRVHVVEQPLWSHEGEKIDYDPHWGRTTIVADQGTATASTTSIDRLLETGVVDRVDLIKLDIEGAEPDALAGARTTIERFSPKLAISAYHRPDDLVVLPDLIAELGEGYALYLDHSLPSAEETILFGRPPG